MAFDAFLDIKGVEGESTAKGFEKKIEIYSFSWGASNPTTIGSGSGGHSAGKASLSSFNVMKKTEKSSATLFQACCDGTHYESATVTLRKATGAAGQKPFLVYKFEDILVESIQWSGSSGGDDTPTESVSLSYGKVEIEYWGQNAKVGDVKPMGQAAYNITTASSK